MQVGVDSFTLSPLKLDPFEMLDYAKKHELEGVQFGGLPGWPDLGMVREVRAHADSLGLYSHVGTHACNPHFYTGPPEEHAKETIGMIEGAAECGWHELHSLLGGLEERYSVETPWEKQLKDSTEFIRRLQPVLRNNGSRVNLETHGEATTFEYVRLIEDVGPDVVGICLDTANVLLFAEDPVEAARRAAPYTHLTHAKDAILYFTDEGLTRQGRPPGQGILDWEKILPALAEYSPDLPLSIEDHKWVFGAAIFDPDWYAGFPDLTASELGTIVRHAWHCQEKIHSREWPDPDAYEAIPFIDQLEERLLSGRDYLRRTLRALGLHGTGESASAG